MLFKNLSTQQEVNVSNLKMRNGRIFFSVRDKGCGARFYSRNTMLVLDEEAEDGTYLKLVEGWALAKPARQPKAKANAASETPASNASNAASETPKGEDASAKDSASQPASETPASAKGEGEGKAKGKAPKANASQPASNGEKATKPAAASTPATPTKPAPATASASEDGLSAAATAFAEAVRAAKGTQIDEAQVEAICRRIVAEAIAETAAASDNASASNAVTIKVLGEGDTHKVNNPHPLLKKVLPLVVNDRIIGRFPWLFGPAGSGKSTLAKQIAEALGLPFYSVSSLQQKYELEGYTDAVGELVETTFYKASKEGGIFLFDEASTTSGEVNVAFNSMLANLWYNFPKVGMVSAHKDFHVIAADNTTGRGGNSTYSARFQLDASTLDRYTAIRVDYTNEHDLFMAEGDKELVTFIRDMRKAIEDARLTYTASPRALRAIVQMAKLMPVEEAFYLGLCSSWAQNDIVTLAARLNGCGKYYRMFKAIAANK